MKRLNILQLTHIGYSIVFLLWGLPQELDLILLLFLLILTLSSLVFRHLIRFKNKIYFKLL